MTIPDIIVMSKLNAAMRLNFNCMQLEYKL